VGYRDVRRGISTSWIREPPSAEISKTTSEATWSKSPVVKSNVPRGDDPEVAAKLRIEERELEAGE
jgi:hypothetical protein